MSVSGIKNVDLHVKDNLLQVLIRSGRLIPVVRQNVHGFIHYP
jgi:hypothetical protein